MSHQQTNQKRRAPKRSGKGTTKELGLAHPTAAVPVDGAGRRIRGSTAPFRTYHELEHNVKLMREKIHAQTHADEAETQCIDQLHHPLGRCPARPRR
jgi:hypothetical protein